MSVLNDKAFRTALSSFVKDDIRRILKTTTSKECYLRPTVLPANRVLTCMLPLDLCMSVRRRRTCLLSLACIESLLHGASPAREERDHRHQNWTLILRTMRLRLNGETAAEKFMRHERAHRKPRDDAPDVVNVVSASQSWVRGRCLLLSFALWKSPAQKPRQHLIWLKRSR